MYKLTLHLIFNYPVQLQLVQGPFDLKENYLIKEPSVVLLLLELLPNLSEPLQVRIFMWPGASGLYNIYDLLNYYSVVVIVSLC